MGIRPFGKSDSFGAFRALVQQTIEEIRSLDGNYILNAAPAELERYYTEKVHINPLELYVDQKYIDDESRVTTRMNDYGTPISVGGTEIRIAIPYQGDKALWHVRPSSFSLSGYPELTIYDDRILFSHTIHDNETGGAERIKATIDREVGAIAGAVRNLASDIEQHNRTAKEEVRRALTAKVGQARATSAAISSLGIPVKKRGEPLTYAIPVRRKPSPIARPVVSTEKYAAEPELPAAEFDFILRVMKSMAVVMERDPNSFSELDEPAIRTHFLLQLNGHYEGGATGETFNAAGKTDILVRVQDRNVFIAECKFWRGPKSFEEAIDQLISYLSWRDSKCALLIFNQNRDTSAVGLKMHEIMTGRPEFRKTTHEPAEGEARYVFVKASDPGREIQICTMLFDVPTG